jgi:hypothetical protein
MAEKNEKTVAPEAVKVRKVEMVTVNGVQVERTTRPNGTVITNYVGEPKAE